MAQNIQQRIDEITYLGLITKEERNEYLAGCINNCGKFDVDKESSAHIYALETQLDELRAKYRTLVRIQRNLTKGN